MSKRQAARAAVLAVALGLVAAAACKPVVRIDGPVAFDEDDPRAQPATSADPDATIDATGDTTGDTMGNTRTRPRGAGDEPRPERVGQRSASVQRAAVNAVLDQGPGSLLRGVEVKPHFRGSSFDGWEIVQFLPGDTRMRVLDLYPGDIIGPVNGHVLARPQHLAVLWTELRSAASIVIRVRRGTQVFELRFDITDGDGAKPAPP